MTAAVAQPPRSASGRRLVAGATALLQGGLAIGLSLASLFLPGAAWALPVYLIFFGVGAVAAAVHAAPGLAERWSLLRVRPGTVLAVVCFFAGSLHGLVAVGAGLAIFLSQDLWTSVAMFFTTVLTLLAISLLFAASGYFLATMDRVRPVEDVR